MSLSEFEWAMEEMMQDKEYLYGSLTKDLYFLGLVLNRKYNLLRITYSVFMVGIVVSVLAFGTIVPQISSKKRSYHHLFNPNALLLLRFFQILRFFYIDRYLNYF